MTTWLKTVRERNRTTLLYKLTLLLTRQIDPAQVERVYLFGSWARGDFHGRSDIDLLVVLKPGVPETAIDLDTLEPELGRPVDIVFMDMARYQAAIARRLPFFAAVEADKQLLWTV